MRPTELKFRSPKEITPSFLYCKVTSDGRKLDYPKPKVKVPANPYRLRPQSKSQIGQSFSKETRFPQYKVWANNTSQFLGPGTHKQLEKQYRKLTQPACASKFEQSILGFDANKSCYQMTGNHLVYEGSFQESGVKKMLEQLDLQYSSVNPQAGLSKTATESMKKFGSNRMSKSLNMSGMLDNHNQSVNTSYMQSTNKKTFNRSGSVDQKPEGEGSNHINYETNPNNLTQPLIQPQYQKVYRKRKKTRKAQRPHSSMGVGYKRGRSVVRGLSKKQKKTLNVSLTYMLSDLNMETRGAIVKYFNNKKKKRRPKTALRSKP